MKENENGNGNGIDSLSEMIGSLIEMIDSLSEMIGSLIEMIDSDEWLPFSTISTYFKLA
jgi:hypothetical protein